MGDLFSSLSAAEHFRDLACVGYYNGDAGLAQGFAEAAEAIFSVWQSRARSNDRLLPPIAYNYRHALELTLKQAIRQAAVCRQLDGDDDPGLTPQALEAHFKQKQRQGHLKTSASHVDVTRLVEHFRAAFDVIHSGVLTALDEYATFLHEMRAEYISPLIRADD